jgi:Flp pilus assembly protein TadG
VTVVPIRDTTDVGAAEALGLVIIFPVMLLLAVLVVAIGRDIDATAQARSAAQAGAQAAALQRSPATGERAMRDVVGRMLDTSTSCIDSTTSLAWAVPVGVTPGTATVVLTCTRPGAGLQRLNRSDQTFSVTAIASIDPLRASLVDDAFDDMGFES